MSQLPGLPSWGQGWLDSYIARAGIDDVVRGDSGRGARWWHHLFDGVATITEGHLQRLQDRVGRQVAELGTAFRLPGDQQERPWPLSALPLLIGQDEWTGISAGVAQRAELLERLLADIYGPADLVSSGRLPAALVTGSRHFWRSMIDVPPTGGHRLQFYAVDLARGPDGEWRVLADHVRAPAGAGYALENRLGASRVMGTLQTRLNVERLAPFFAAFREGLAAACHRAEPRIGLLTPGRYNPSYAEQAHLARYLGILLVEGDDLAVREDRLYVRTIEGLKRVDALWRRMDTRFLDPLAFDAGSGIGVPALMDAMLAGNAIIANHPGVGVVESPAMAAFLPALSRRLLGTDLLLPNIATWWCGQDWARGQVQARLDEMLITPAFADAPAGLPGGQPVLGGSLDPAARAALAEAIARRPMDYVGQEVVHLSTMPAVSEGQLVARPFTLRAFAARDGKGHWTVMPGGFARLSDVSDVRATVMGEGAFSADVCIAGLDPVAPVSLLPHNIAIRRNPGTLPSRAADNLYWLGRYLERGEATLRLVRSALGGTIDADGGGALVPVTLERIATMLISSGAAVAETDEDEEGDDDRGGVILDLPELARDALDGPGSASVRSVFASVRNIGEGIRDRLSADVWRLLDKPPPVTASADAGALAARVTALQERFSALAGLAAENMSRNAGWRFHDMGRRLERAVVCCRLLRTFAGNAATQDDLTTLLDLVDSQISYRSRYLAGIALVPVRDLIALDPSNPRSLAFQIARVTEHLAAIPNLRDDGMAEEQQVLATELTAAIATAKAESLGGDAVLAMENRLYALSDAIGRRFFLQGAETIRAPGMTLA
ncbi:circularly permuted type 2 ATP-grasp protein [Sphingomonas naphthae]|uniref:Circularly permuted type 2 ATP-grasp protein n=1 Tax=Sphingomonas naphthae TaxID=1813468 RepID=A0ABY7TRC9_9SPHN|nr:circularly permuted type 2 ATP-grasp protein [Sphingomonas naphthae]WCT75510.1 circularly permuted type 2 ATP-grasp protein [Sphingomonas naphthae]